jgi:hypothetical protein
MWYSIAEEFDSSGREQMRQRGWIACALVVLLAGGAVFAAHHDSGAPAQTPAPLVMSYDSLADIIIAGKKAEWNLVHSILGATYEHAQGTMMAVNMQIESGDDASAGIEKLATLVGQLGTEGDAAVAAVRKRLIEAGHHHHATAADEEKYDTGYVIVTRAAKKVFLDAAGNIAKMAGSPDKAALAAEWKKVQTQFKALHPESAG